MALRILCNRKLPPGSIPSNCRLKCVISTGGKFNVLLNWKEYETEDSDDHPTDGEEGEVMNKKSKYSSRHVLVYEVVI